ncbi:MAG: TRCF domain-containing protein, partial [bacterium]
IMDRLICGDVGYGKTEIAIRAAFKAVQDGKQVAFLVPTTILAQQHYNTFVQRMKEFPLRVDLLCRFRTSAEIKKTVADLKKGLVDIVVGTHRLLSKDIAFKDLGLLVIDEEQRFGVTHKEKIKQLRKDVDVLTLTATPIPRTLHMSLSGIREMSVLEEPPRDRVPIQTYVSEYSDEIVREAICRELARHGQVYFVHNRVADIAERAEKIHNLVPEANVAFAHGQMRPSEIEDIMVDFINGEIDVLVTTTIVETGLDIANVNTIIINDADRYGLSQLYQLRGRVGRSSRTAYAFLMYKRDKMLKEVAEKRLSAIREFTQLGSGFRIAMRDLEIRGAGNVLGAEQHGQMEAVGYDLYCKMLAAAVREAKGEEPEQKSDFETVVDLAADAYIPDEYVPDEFLKLDFYKRIAAIGGNEDYEDISDELMDRFGVLPQPVRNLLAIAELKAAAHAASIEEIKEKKDGIRLKVHKPPTFDTAAVPKTLAAFGGMFRLDSQRPGDGFTYHGPTRTGEMILNLKTFCNELTSGGQKT